MAKTTKCAPMARTVNSTDFTVKYVFGSTRCSSGLLPLSRGRLQALSIAWDARPAAEGGQRWYHLYPEETIDYRDPLHWTGPYQNWNSAAPRPQYRPGENYNPADHSSNTTFEEIDVRGRHGPGEKHLELAAENPRRRQWRLHYAGPAGRGPGRWCYHSAPHGAPDLRAQVDSCGCCHCAAGTWANTTTVLTSLATHCLACRSCRCITTTARCWTRTTYGSFLQSKMHLAGVVWQLPRAPLFSCARPTTLVLRPVPPAPAVRHTQTLPSPHRFQRRPCANCHMPETTYMGSMRAATTACVSRG